MHAQERRQKWDPTTLRKIIALTGLQRKDIAALAGRSTPQISRWLSGEHRPEHGALRDLIVALRTRHPEVADLAQKLMTDAGYATVPEMPPLEEEVPDDITDPAEIDIWRNPHLSDGERRFLVDALRALRNVSVSRLPDAEVRSFRRRE